MWELPASQSVEADIRFQPRDADSRTSPLMLESIHSASGEVPARVGEAAGDLMVLGVGEVGEGGLGRVRQRGVETLQRQ